MVATQRGRDYWHQVPATADTQRGDFSGFPWDLSFNSPDYVWTGSNVSPGLRLDSPLGEQSSLHVAGRYTKIDGDINAQGLAGLAADGRTAIRFQYHEVDNVEGVPDRHVRRDELSNRSSQPSARHRRGSGFEHGRQ